MTIRVTIGEELPVGDILIKFNSQNDFIMHFWDDANNTIPSDLSGVTATTLEVSTSAGVLNWAGNAPSTNNVAFSITSTSSNVTWDTAPYELSQIKNGKRYLIMSGNVQIQR